MAVRNPHFRAAPSRGNQIQRKRARISVGVHDGIAVFAHGLFHKPHIRNGRPQPAGGEMELRAPILDARLQLRLGITGEEIDLHARIHLFRHANWIQRQAVLSDWDGDYFQYAQRFYHFSSPSVFRIADSKSNAR